MNCITAASARLRTIRMIHAMIGLASQENPIAQAIAISFTYLRKK